MNRVRRIFLEREGWTRCSLNSFGLAGGMLIIPEETEFAVRLFTTCDTSMPDVRTGT